MKQILQITFLLLTVNCYGQVKSDEIYFNKLTEVTGTEYVIATVENWGKMEGLKSRYLLFINTRNGESRQVSFPNDGYFEKVEQVKIDSLGINKIIVTAQTVDLDGRKGIDWNDPKQLIILSTDGNERTQLTDSKLFASAFTVNRQTGTITVSGHYDSNNNNKHDRGDKAELVVYDLRTLKPVFKF